MLVLLLLAYAVGCFAAVVIFRYFDVRDNGDTAVRIPLTAFWPIVLPVWTTYRITKFVFIKLSTLADFIVRKLKSRNQ